jgi:hypothetical protein
MSEISDTKTYADYVRKNDLETMTDAHQVATDNANKIILAQQRMEIEQLKAQRLDDLAQREQETKTSNEKASVQEEATEILRQEAVQTKLEIHALRRDMQDMMQQFKSALAAAAELSQENKRILISSNEDNSQSEKRRDVRSTPGKKLFTDEVDLRDSEMYLSALAATTTQSSPMK